MDLSKCEALADPSGLGFRGSKHMVAAKAAWGCP